MEIEHFHHDRFPGRALFSRTRLTFELPEEAELMEEVRWAALTYRNNSISMDKTVRREATPANCLDLTGIVNLQRIRIAVLAQKRLNRIQKPTELLIANEKYL